MEKANLPLSEFSTVYCGPQSQRFWHSQKSRNGLILLGLNIKKRKTTKTQKTEYTFLSSAHEIFSKTDHITGQKRILNKFKRIEIF